MTKKRQLGDFLTFSFLIIIIGLIIIIAGIYFETNSMTSSGVTMGRYGRPYGTGTIDGKGMIFCGINILGAGFLIKGRKDSGNTTNK